MFIEDAPKMPPTNLKKKKYIYIYIYIYYKFYYIKLQIDMALKFETYQFVSQFSKIYSTFNTILKYILHFIVAKQDMIQVLSYFSF